MQWLILIGTLAFSAGGYWIGTQLVPIMNPTIWTPICVGFVTLWIGFVIGRGYTLREFLGPGEWPPRLHSRGFGAGKAGGNQNRPQTVEVLPPEPRQPREFSSRLADQHLSQRPVSGIVHRPPADLN